MSNGLYIYETSPPPAYPAPPAAPPSHAGSVIFAILVIAAGVGLLLWGLNFFITTRNGIVRRRELYEQERANLELLYRRREKLIGKVYDIALKLVGQQTQLHTRLMNDMKEALVSPGAKAGINILNLASMLPSVEAAPNFTMTQKEISRLDDQIIQAVRAVNGDVRDYNTFTGIFPNNIVAGLLGYRKLEAIDDLSVLAGAAS